MSRKLRQKWDSVNDCASVEKPSQAAEYVAYAAATARPIPEYRAKLVKLPRGQYEVSVTRCNASNVINARMGFNPLLDCEKKVRTEIEQLERDDENRKRAVKRARQRVRWLIKCIGGDHMLTFSYRENMLDIKRLKADWQECVRLFRVRYPEWQYVTIREQQDRGSYHLHVAVHGKQDIRWLLRCWLLAIGQEACEVNDWYLRGVAWRWLISL